jgi:integrase
VRALVRSIYRWGLSKDLATVDPTLGVRRERKEQARDRDLSWDEIRAFWRSLDGAMSKQIALAIKLSLVTGQRIGKETTQAAKAEFELNSLSPTWEIPPSRTKNPFACRCRAGCQAGQGGDGTRRR